MIDIVILMYNNVYQCIHNTMSMDIFEGHFAGYPSQEKVARILVEQGIRVEGSCAYSGNIKQSDSAIGRACGVDRRVVRATLERISSTPYLDSVFTKLKSTLSMVDLAPEIGCSSIVITPTDSTMPGILAEITEVLFNARISVRQAMVDDTGDKDAAVLVVVVYGKIPSEILPELRNCRGVSSILIK